jgi:thioesterase domain-containing protein
MPEDLERLVPLRESGNRKPLFCLHPVSGSPYAYNGLVKLLPEDQPVYGFEAPSFDNERPPVNRLPVLADEYARILREFQPSGGFRLLGWSLGGVLAYDIARRLVSAGLPVDRLILVDSGLPWLAELPPEKAIVARFMGDLAGMLGADTEAIDAIFNDTAEDLQAAEIFAKVEQADVLVEEFDAEMLLDRYITFRAHIEALYNFGEPAGYDGEVLHVIAADSATEFMRWDKVAPKLVEVVLPGNHYSIWTGDSLVELARTVEDCLSP